MSFLIVGIFASLSVAMAGPGSSVRGGGEVIDIDGGVELRDLVDRAVCQWDSGAKVLQENPETNRILRNLAQVDWYFAMELRRELEFLTFCWTGPLAKISTEDANAPTATPTATYRPAALRYYSSVYLDRESFGSLSARSRGMLLLHETLHSYLNMKLEFRNLNLRSVVKVISEVDAGRLTSRAEFHQQMKANHVEFPWTVSSLDPHRAAIELLLDSNSEITPRLAANPGELNALEGFSSTWIASSLADWDQARLKLKSENELISERLGALCRDSSETVLSSFLSRPSSGRFSPYASCFRYRGGIDPARMTFILNHPAQNSWLEYYFHRLESRSLSFGRGIILNSSEWSSMSMSTGKAVGLLPLSSADSRDDWSDEVRTYFQLIAYWVKTDNRILLDKYFLKNGRFWTALLPQTGMSVLNTAPVELRAQAQFLSELFPELQSEYLRALVQLVGVEAGPSAARELQKRIEAAK